jgi:predicted transposase YdaD
LHLRASFIREEGHALGLDEGRKEGREEGRTEGARAVRRGILLVLRSRFSEVPEGLSGQLESIQEIEALEKLLEEAATCPDLDTFAETIGKG